MKNAKKSSAKKQKDPPDKWGYKQLNHRDLIHIEVLNEDGYNQSDIAIQIGKNKSTISRLFKKYKTKDGVFDSEVVWQDIQEKRAEANAHYRILPESDLEDYLLEKIVLHWSPEQMAWEWSNSTGETLCHETIYQWFYKNKPEMIKLHFRRKGKKYQHKRKEKYQIKDRKMIDERPEEIEDRLEVWHWEWDTIVGKDHQWAIVTNVERKTGFLIATLLSSSKSEELALTTIKDFEDIPHQLRITMTYDNGREFAQHKKIEKQTNMTVYFAHPYSPWERWSNENTNGLLREFIPKGTDFSTITQQQLDHYVKLINQRPRKRLGFATPEELFSAELKKFSKSCTWR